MRKNSKLDDYVVLRRRAIELHHEGKTQTFIAQALGVSQSTVSRWIAAYKKEGEASLKRPKMGGSKRKLTPEQLQQLTSMLDEGAESHGFQGNLWTRARVQQLIKRHFGVEYKLRSLSDLLRDLGYTLQKPRRRSYQQDPQKVRQWHEETLPRLKKKPLRKATLLLTWMRQHSVACPMCKERITARGSAV